MSTLLKLRTGKGRAAGARLRRWLLCCEMTCAMFGRYVPVMEMSESSDVSLRMPYQRMILPRYENRCFGTRCTAK